MQWGNVGGLIAGLYTQDYDLIGRSLHDEIVEPLRSVLIPGFDSIKQVAIANGALGAGISGSGPSIFALSKGEAAAKKIAEAMCTIYDDIKMPYEIHVSKVNPDGVKIIAP
jgi:homoserine kinase